MSGGSETDLRDRTGRAILSGASRRGILVACLLAALPPMILALRVLGGGIASCLAREPICTGAPGTTLAMAAASLVAIVNPLVPARLHLLALDPAFRLSRPALGALVLSVALTLLFYLYWAGVFFLVDYDD
jgi:hypothetical protein